MKTERSAAPAFRAPASTGKTLSLSDYVGRGRYLVLYFYPAAFTFGCTRETVCFRDAQSQLDALGADLVGISPDGVDTQLEFARHYQVRFPILADPDRAIARAYGALFPVVSRVQRLTFVIDPEGYIVARFHHELRFERHVDDAVTFMKKVRGAA